MTGNRALRGIILFVLCIAVVPLSAQTRSRGKTGTYDPPTLSCATSTGSSVSVTVTAGATGAPAGFSLHWMLESDFLLMGWPVDGGFAPESYCEASFSGNAHGAAYNLAPGGSVTVELGDILFDTPGASSRCENVPLRCGQRYVFRAFAHATSSMFRSPWSADQSCSTLPCQSTSCTYTQGYWKTHGPIPTGNNSNMWPVTSMTLGTVTYTDLELLAILNRPAAGNGLVALAHQLIAARLNEANGADVSAVVAALGAADSLIGSLVVPPIGTGSLHPSTTSGLSSVLADFNEGLIGPGHCPN